MLAFEQAQSLKSEVVNPTKSEEATTTTAPSPDQRIEAAPVAMPTEIPILMYHHIRDFVDTSDQIGTNLSVSPAKFATQLELIKSKGYTTTTFEEIASGQAPSKPIILTFDDGYSNFFESAYPALKLEQMKAVAFVITGETSSDYMTETQIREINTNGIEVGSHTISHPDLTKISQEKVSLELKDSKIALEKILGHNIVSLCYPAGKENSEVVSTAREAGYFYAVTTKYGIGDLKSDNLLLSRYRVNADTNIAGFLK
ncbi:MAG: polysaccharide deacetylase family protein [Patescibacteria group bacterium]